jgi:hypothetical protein
MEPLNLRHFLIDWLNYRVETAFEALAEHDIRVARDERYPALYNLKYGSVMADKALPIVRACRGAVVELVDDGTGSPYFRLVAYAFDRFFNVGEGYAAEIDWATARVVEKYDGSLIKLFSYKGDWVVSTSGSVAGSSEVGTTGRSFSELFWHVFNEVGYDRADLDPYFVYVYELCHKDNKIVVDYETPLLPLLAVRSRFDDLNEVDLKHFENRFNIAQTYDLRSHEAVTQFVNDSSRGTAEGVIIVDGKGNRQKDKSNVYCQLHRVKGNGDPDFSELFLNDDLEEFLLHFPEYRRGFDVHLRSIEVMESAVSENMRAHNHLNQKDFAQAVLAESKELSGACFAIRSGKVGSFAEWLEGLTPKKLDVLLGIA